MMHDNFYNCKSFRVSSLRIVKFFLYVWQLGIAEKNFVNYDLDPVATEPSDANTNSTALFSDDTDDKSHKSNNLEMAMSVLQEDEVSVK